MTMITTSTSTEPPKPRKHRIVAEATWRGRGRNREGGKTPGPGFKLHGVWNSLMLPVVAIVTPIHVHDKTGGLQHVLPELDRILARLPRKLRVMVADSAYWGLDVLTTLVRLGIVPCIHESSHKRSESTRREVEKKDKTFIRIADSKWWANQHFELFCECGQGTIAFDIKLGETGRALIRTDAECDHCGHHAITAGMWRIKQNPRRFVKEWKGVPPDDLRPALGNPLTYHSPEAEVYGLKRFGWGESPHAQLQRGYRVGGKHNLCPVESQAHLEYVIYTICSLMWANAIERVKQAGAWQRAAA